MAEKGKWKVTLADGSSIIGLGLNGTSFVSESEITEAAFKGKLAHVVIEGPESEDGVGLRGEHKNMELTYLRHEVGVPGLADGYYFGLRELTAAELRQIQVDSRLDYIEMMEGL